MNIERGVLLRLVGPLAAGLVAGLLSALTSTPGNLHAWPAWILAMFVVFLVPSGAWRDRRRFRGAARTRVLACVLAFAYWATVMAGAQAGSATTATLAVLWLWALGVCLVVRDLPDHKALALGAVAVTVLLLVTAVVAAGPAGLTEAWAAVAAFVSAPDRGAFAVALLVGGLALVLGGVADLLASTAVLRDRALVGTAVTLGGTTLLLLAGSGLVAGALHTAAWPTWVGTAAGLVVGAGLVVLGWWELRRDHHASGAGAVVLVVGALATLGGGSGLVASSNLGTLTAFLVLAAFAGLAVTFAAIAGLLGARPLLRRGLAGARSVHDRVERGEGPGDLRRRLVGTLSLPRRRVRAR